MYTSSLLMKLCRFTEVFKVIKPVILYNMKGFWNPLLDMLAAMREAGMMRDGFERQLLVASSHDELVETLSRMG